MEVTNNDLQMAPPPLPSPEKFQSEIWKLLHQVNNKLDSVNNEQSRISKEIYQSGGILEQVEKLESLSGAIGELEGDSSNQRFEMRQLKSIMIKQSQEIDSLKRRCLDLESRSMRENIVIHGEIELAHENPFTVVRSVMIKLNIPNADTIEIERAHRMGAKNNKSHRLLVAKLLRFTDTVKVMKAAREAATAANSKPIITQQLPIELLEQRKLLGSIAYEAKQKDSKVTTRMQNNRLFINNELYKPSLVTPKPRDVFNLSTADLRSMSTIVGAEGEDLTASGSRFKAAVAQVKSMDRARAAYTKLMTSPDNMSASHNVAVVRLYSPEGARVTEATQDDGEWGASRFILRHLQQNHPDLQNVAIFLTRHHYGENLGRKRFEMMAKAVDNAIKVFKRLPNLE